MAYTPANCFFSVQALHRDPKLLESPEVLEIEEVVGCKGSEKQNEEVIGGDALGREERYLPSRTRPDITENI